MLFLGVGRCSRLVGFADECILSLPIHWWCFAAAAGIVVRRPNHHGAKKQVPELREALGSFRPTSNGSDGNLVPMFTASLRDTFNAADRSTEAIPPAMFVQVCKQQPV